MSAQRSQHPDEAYIAYEMDGPESEATRARVTENLELVQRFVTAVFADPSIVDGVRHEENVILLPKGDAVRAHKKIMRGLDMKRAGRSVRFVTV